MESVEIYKAALEKWGVADQTSMAIEEMAECMVAINHAKRGRIAASSLASEIADVEIMMGQMRFLVGSELVDREKKKKLKRLLERISK